MLAERDRDDAARVVLATIAPALFATTLLPSYLDGAGVADWAVTAVLALVLLSAARAFPSWPGLARAAATAALLTAVAAWAIAHPDCPGTALALLLALGALLAGLWPAYTGGSWLRDRSPVAAASTVVLLVAMLAWSLGTGGPAGSLGLAGAAVVPATVALWSAQSRGGRQVASVALLAPIVFSVFGLAELGSTHATVLLAAGPALLLVRAVRRTPVATQPGWSSVLEVVFESPARQLVLGFAALCVLGTAVLQLPVCDVDGVGHNLVDATFTAVSAACVTGLTVLDITKEFTWLGQLTIAVLIQIGGLGIMTFAASAVLWAGSRLRVRHERVAAGMLGAGGALDVRRALRRVLAVTAVSEVLGAALLFPAFLVHGDSAPRAVWRAAFTSISAFCNAGFALQSTNMVPYQSDPYVLVVVGCLILVGSLGPIVVASIPALVSGRRTTLFVRISVAGTVVCVAAGMIGVLLLEGTATMEGMSLVDRLANSWFHAVGPRTAGFNSIDLARAHPATVTLTMLLMVIGGCSGSTAGGLKITTVVVLLSATVAAIRKQPAAGFSRRLVRHRTVYEAGAIATVYGAIALAGLLMFQLTQRQPLEMALFEVLSAIGTVGLSIGGTMQVDAVGKIVLIALMFSGRVGPLTLFFFLSEGGGASAPFEYPSEEVAVG